MEKQIKLEIEYLPITDLEPYINNTKKHPEKQIDQIVKSIKEYGMSDPIAIWGKNNEIVEGHGRLLALMKMGAETAPVIRLDHLTDEQRRAYSLIHNKLTMNSGFDKQKLEIELNAIDSIDMAQFNFKMADDLEIEPQDLSGAFEKSYTLEVICDTEDARQKLYDRLSNEGYLCQIM